MISDEFIRAVKRLVNEKGKEIFNDIRTSKGLLLDYTHGDCRNEINFLSRILELDYYKIITSSNDLAADKYKLIRKLNEEYFITQEIAEEMVMLLISVLRDDVYNENSNMHKNIPEYKNNQNNSKENSNVLKLAKFGWSAEEISKVLKLSKERVANIIANNGKHISHLFL
jgi:DNA-binding NarL/FixJ family response regulator